MAEYTISKHKFESLEEKFVHIEVTSFKTSTKWKISHPKIDSEKKKKKK